MNLATAYEALKAKYDALSTAHEELKAEYLVLQSERDKLENKVDDLRQGYDYK